MRRPAIAVLLFVLSAGQPALAKDAAEGRYRLDGGHDVAAELILHPGGRFEYALAEGALDEHAEGIWVRRGNTLVLTTQPKPVPPVFTTAPRGAPTPGAPTLRVTWPDGRGIPGVDFRIGFASGDPVSGYTQEDGWTLLPEEQRKPLWIELFEPIYRIASPRYPIDGTTAGTLNFVIVPHDIGTVDFAGTVAEVGPKDLLLHRAEGDMHFVRVSR